MAGRRAPAARFVLAVSLIFGCAEHKAPEDKSHNAGPAKPKSAQPKPSFGLEVCAAHVAKTTATDESNQATRDELEAKLAAQEGERASPELSAQFRAAYRERLLLSLHHALALESPAKIPEDRRAEYQEQRRFLWSSIGQSAELMLSGRPADFEAHAELTFYRLIAYVAVSNAERADHVLVELENYHPDSPWRVAAEQCVSPEFVAKARAQRPADGFNALRWQPNPVGIEACDEANRRLLCVMRGTRLNVDRVREFQRDPLYSAKDVESGLANAEDCAAYVAEFAPGWERNGC